MDNNDTRWIVGGLIIVGLAAGAWLFRDVFLPPAEPPPEPAVVETPPEPAKPLEPIYPVEPIQPLSEGGELIPLPPLGESDEYFALALFDVFGDDLEELLVSELLVERTVGTIDNLGRERVPERIRPIGRLPGTFLVDGTGGDVGYMLSPRNYERYDQVIGILENASVADMIETYRRFYPLLEEAYVMLGYPDGHLNDRVVDTIDLMLATPEPSGPVHLVRETVLYQYRDPELESLASSQKMLLRMGNANARRVKKVLRELRAELTGQAEAP